MRNSRNTDDKAQEFGLTKPSNLITSGTPFWGEVGVDTLPHSAVCISYLFTTVGVLGGGGLGILGERAVTRAKGGGGPGMEPGSAANI